MRRKLWQFAAAWIIDPNCFDISFRLAFLQGIVNESQSIHTCFKGESGSLKYCVMFRVEVISDYCLQEWIDTSSLLFKTNFIFYFRII